MRFRKLDIKYVFALLLLAALLGMSSCASLKKRMKTPVAAANYFSGLIVFDPATGDTLISDHAKYYFTPASTLKLLTLYASVETLPDSIATVSYAGTPDTLYIQPAADPSFLHDSLPNKTYDFLRSAQKNIVVVPDSFPEFKYGMGWQWDDYEFYYMPEKNLFPLYGNLVRIFPGGKIIPSYFSSQLFDKHPLGFGRDFNANNFYINDIKEMHSVPYMTSLSTQARLLADTLHLPVTTGRLPAHLTLTPYVSTPLIPVYKQLMDESENFLAEQLMLILSKRKTGVYQVKKGIGYVLDSLLSGLPQKPRWVDASGLSRYNLITPEDMLYVLHKMYKRWGKEKVYSLLPYNGPDGKSHPWYPSEFTFVHAKTGSLSNNHSLCGFLDTKSGKTLIFCYMNNNFRVASSVVKGRMNDVLKQIYERY